METTCWTRGYHLQSKDPIRQVLLADVTNKIGVSSKYRNNSVGAVGEEEDMAPETGLPGEPSIRSDTQEHAPLKVARDPGDDERARRSQRNAHTLPFLVSNLRQSERKGGGAQKWKRTREEL